MAKRGSSRGSSVRKQRKAATRIQAWIRRWIVRKRMTLVWELVKERTRQGEKIKILHKKLARVQQERQEIAKKGVVSGNIRQNWEDSILKKEEEAEHEEEELSPMAYQIHLLQLDHKDLQVRYQMVKGILRPLQKNLQTLMDQYHKHREAYDGHDGQRKALDESNGELIRRRKELERKIQEFQDEINGISNKAARLAQGPVNNNILKGMKDIMNIMKTECRDKELVADIREMIRQFNSGALTNTTMDTSHFSPSKRPVGRR
jgi:chromosome segregation ATPase